MLFRAAKMKASCEEVQKDLLVLSKWTAKYGRVLESGQPNGSEKAPTLQKSVIFLSSS